MVPPWSQLMSNVVKSEVMHEHAVPVTLIKLCGEMSCNVVIYLSKVLIYAHMRFRPRLI